MENQYSESKEIFKISFGGKKSIDAELFTRTINNTIELIKASSQAIDPQSFLRLEIKANQEGSFETVIEAIAKYSTDLINKENIKLAGDVLKGYLTFLDIKKHLKGQKAKEIKQVHNQTDIRNEENETLKVPTNLASTYFANSKIDTVIVNVFTDLEQAGRTNFDIYTDNSSKPTRSFKRNDYEAMSKKLVDGNKQQELPSKEQSQTVENCSLIVKKPDLLGNSKWDFIYNQAISAKIEDEEFLNKIKNGEISLSGGSRIICTLKIHTVINKEYDVVGSEYTVVTVKEVIPPLYSTIS